MLTKMHTILQWRADQTKPTDAVLRAVQHGSPRPWDEPVPVRGFDSVSLESLGLAPRTYTQTEVDAAYIQGRGEGVSKGREEGHAAGLAEGERREREAVVRYMRARANDGPCVEDVADEIERGELPDPDCGWCHGGGTVSSSIDIRQPECPCRYERGDHRQEAEHE